MFFFKQFQGFDPQAGYVPSRPFTYLPEIAYRARALLRNRTAEQIETAAKRISEEVDEYFRDLKDCEISRLLSEFEGGDETHVEFFEWDGGTRKNGRWVFKEEAEGELEILTAENCSEVNALKTIIENRDSCFFLPEGAPEPERDEWPEGFRHELFAVLSLWLLADAMERMVDKSKYGLSIAGEYAIKAMDAVCYAEHLRETDWIESYIKKKANAELTEALQKQRIEQQEWIRYCEKIRKERVLTQKSKRAKELNALRHQDTNKAKNLVIGEWNKNRNQFPSGEQAGLHYADWLETQGVFHKHSRENNSYEWYTPRTVTKWIRDYAKEIGFLFRP
ncbi:MAG: hypothetical protein ABL869_01005 [Candidatus Nitrotoga sp.]